MDGTIESVESEQTDGVSAAVPDGWMSIESSGGLSWLLPAEESSGEECEECEEQSSEHEDGEWRRRYSPPTPRAAHARPPHTVECAGHSGSGGSPQSLRSSPISGGSRTCPFSSVAKTSA